MLGVGWALVDARIGDSRPHRHLAHQFSLAIDGDLEISCDGSENLSSGAAWFIPAHAIHRLGPTGAHVRSLYLEPWSTGGALVRQAAIIERLPPAQVAALRAIVDAADARCCAMSFARHSPSRDPDGRLLVALSRVRPGATPRDLALAAGISASRLRELAIRDFGVPPAKLLQWLQLQKALTELRETSNFASAAAAGGFSDQSHFTRRCVQWFGVTPAAGLGSLSIHIGD